jgi:hypothetical protein
VEVVDYKEVLEVEVQEDIEIHFLQNLQVVVEVVRQV